MKIFKTKFLLLAIILINLGLEVRAQNCTVNAGIDQSYCLKDDFNSNLNIVNNLFTLTGNSAGNINATPNLLWELVSAPAGVNVTFGTPNANTTTVRATYRNAPTGVYTFRLGIDCQAGGRVFDNVTITITNVADFQLFADKKFSDYCADVSTSFNFVGRPLKTGEVLELGGTGLTLTSTNANTGFFTNFSGPTVDSVRFTATNLTNCALSAGPRIFFKLSNNGCNTSFLNAIADFNKTPLGTIKTVVEKISLKKIDTLATCLSPTAVFSLPIESICIRGGQTGLTNYNNSGRLLVTRLTGSGDLSIFNMVSGILQYNLSNNWDTVTNNTLSTWEITYLSNGCFTTVKDTIKVFFQSKAPSLDAFSFTGFPNDKSCEDGPFPLSTYKYEFIASGIIPANYEFSTIFTSAPAGVSITNPQSKDTLIFAGAIVPGIYEMSTTVTDITSGCSISRAFSVHILQRLQLPVLRDTVVCKSNLPFNSLLNIPYPSRTFGIGGSGNYWQQYLIEPLNGSVSAIAVDDRIRIDFNLGDVGVKGFRVYPNTSYPGASCTNGISDTFYVTVQSSGYIANAGTDQSLLCNVNTTSLAGSDPISTGGVAGFWKFLPAISTNAGAPIVIADTASRTTLVSGFSDLSTYYFSWNVTDGNTGNYCGLRPDTVRIIFSGIPPNAAQAAQADFTGCLPASGIYNLTSNAVTPTFGVQWNQITGPASTITTAQNGNTNVTGLTLGTYTYEIVVTNACGTFKDTVTLNFTSNCSVLPVKLINFNGTQNLNTDILTWEVTEDINLDHYELETSTDGRNFHKAGHILSNNVVSNTKQYSYSNVVTDLINYYRLKIVNNDGGFSYSTILKINRTGQLKNKIDVRPIPTVNDLNISIFSENSYHTTLKLINSLGQTVMNSQINIYKGNNVKSLSVSEYPRGIYILNIGDMSTKIVLQ